MQAPQIYHYINITSITYNNGEDMCKFARQMALIVL